MSPRPSPPPPRPPVLRPAGGMVPVLATAILVFVLVFCWLALQRHAAFWTGRFDLGNMVQAVWATAHGHPLEVTSTSGVQFIRLGAHVDPILAVFAPLWWVWPAPQMLLVVQVVVVATGAVPAALLGRRWIGDETLALACGIVYLMYPAIQWSLVTEFHPVTLATPLLLWCIWAVDTDRTWVLMVLAPLAALTKEQVGVALAMIGVWALVRRSRRRVGAALIGGGLTWSLVCFLFIIPHFSPVGESPFVGRYAELGESQGAVLKTVVTRPWEALAIMVDGGRPGYLAAMLLPLLLLPLLAPMVALGALPELGLNLLAQYWPQYSVQYQYTAVTSAFLIAGTIGGIARLRRMRLPGRAASFVADPVGLSAIVVGAVVAGGYVQGPLPFWGAFPGGSTIRTHEYTVTRHAHAQAGAVAVVPGDVAVSTSNLLGSRLSARRHVYTWPVIRDAAWVVVDTKRPFIGDRISEAEHRWRVAALERDRRFQVRYSVDGVLVFERIR